MRVTLSGADVGSKSSQVKVTALETAQDQSKDVRFHLIR